MRRILIIIILLILVGGGVLYFQSKNNSGGGEGGSVSQRTFQTLFNKIIPFGDGTSGDPEGTSTEEGGEGGFENTLQRFREVSPTPIAGYTVFTATKKITNPSNPKITETVSEPGVRYVARANGYVYEIKNGGFPTQISNIFVPNIYEAFFVGQKIALLRFLREDNRTIATYSVPIPDENPDGTRTQKSGVYLQENIKNIAVSPDTKSIVRLLVENGSTVISTSDPIGASKKELVRSPFQSWNFLWPNQNTYLQTKASAQATGFLYQVDSVYKRLVRVLGDIQGLTALISPTGSYVVYSETVGQSFITKILNTKTNTTKTLNVSILPEKCVWLKEEFLFCAGNEYITPGTYPDDWYAGITSFNDKLYRILPESGFVETLNSGDDFSYDATQLLVNEDQKILYFIDKKTGILWSYNYR